MRAIATALLASSVALATVAATPPRPATAARVVASIAIPDGGWDFAEFDPATRRVFIARTDGITAVDIATGLVTPRLAGAAHAHAVLPLPGMGALLETDGATNSARIIDTRTGAVRATIAVGDKPDAAIWDGATRTVIVMNAKSGTLSIVDPQKQAVARTVTLSPGLEFAAIDAHRRLFVNNEDGAQLHVVDLASGRVMPPIALPGCEAPTGLAYSRRADRLVAACANGKAAVVDPVAGKVVAMLDIGLGPDDVIADEARGVAYIPCGGSGVVDVLDFSRDGGVRVAAQWPTAVGARTGALDALAQRLYLPAARYAPAVGKARPAMLPGSAHLLVVNVAR